MYTVQAQQCDLGPIHSTSKTTSAILDRLRRLHLLFASSLSCNISLVDDDDSKTKHTNDNKVVISRSNIGSLETNSVDHLGCGMRSGAFVLWAAGSMHTTDTSSS